MLMRDVYTLDAYEPTADESAEIKQILKRDPLKPWIEMLAETHFCEASEAYEEVITGRDELVPDSWVAHEIGKSYM